MLSLRKKSAVPVRPEPGALDLLLECHERIRRFTRMAVWLAHAGDAPPAAVQETATAVLRYFTEGLPRHSKDEDESLAPRLRAAVISADLRASLESMTRQHEGLEEVISALVPAWREVANDPQRLLVHTDTMERLTDQLCGMWAVHLNLEENHIFPAARAHLPPKAWAEILEEMRARRR